MSLCRLWCWFLSVFSHFVPHCDHFCACFVSVFSQLASLCSFKIILHSPLVSVELSDRRYLPQHYAVAASSCFLWVTCSFVFRWEPSGCGKAESVCRELKRAAAEIRRRTSQNKTISERRELFLARLSLRLWSVLHRVEEGSEATALNADRDTLKFSYETHVAVMSLFGARLFHFNGTAFWHDSFLTH